MKKLVEKLLELPDGEIFLAQVARALSQAPTLEREDVETQIVNFIAGCLDKVDRLNQYQQMLGAHGAFYEDLVIPQYTSLFHMDERDVAPDAQLATVVTQEVLKKYMLRKGVLPRDEASMLRRIGTLSSDDFLDDARVGAGPVKKPQVFWATCLEDILRVVPGAADKSILSADEATRLRDFLGLAHRGLNARMVLLIFRPNALRRHLDAENTKVTRPFLFEGASNARFHLFDRDQPHGWNHALDLNAVVDPKLSERGGREIVLSAMRCAEIERCVALEPVFTPPCESRDQKVLEIMLSGESIEQATHRILEALSGSGKVPRSEAAGGPPQ